MYFQMSNPNENTVIEQLKSDYLNTLQNLLGNMGMDPYIARIIQLLRFQDQPVTQTEMKDKLGLSKPTISRNLKVMEEINILNIDLLPYSEDKKDRYAYSLKDNSTYFIFSKYLKKINELVFGRLEFQKIFMSKVNQLTESQTKDKEFQKLLGFLKEEEVIFKIMASKMDWLMKAFEEESLSMTSEL